MLRGGRSPRELLTRTVRTREEESIMKRKPEGMGREARRDETKSSQDQIRRVQVMRLNRRFAALIAWVVLMAATSGYARAAGYVQSNLISDIPGLAQFTDPTLLNPWGVAFFPGASPFWVNDNNAGLSALYFGSDFGQGFPFPGLPAVTIP